MGSLLVFGQPSFNPCNSLFDSCNSLFDSCYVLFNSYDVLFHFCNVCFHFCHVRLDGFQFFVHQDANLCSNRIQLLVHHGANGRKVFSCQHIPYLLYPCPLYRLPG